MQSRTRSLKDFLTPTFSIIAISRVVERLLKLLLVF
jgi:hypothetical protein